VGERTVPEVSGCFKVISVLSVLLLPFF
jgi:hypothetical protein